VEELLDHIQRGDERRFNDFCIALEASSQPHIANMLRGLPCEGDERDAVRHDAVPHDDNEMPLSSENKCKLTASWNALIDRMSPELMAELESLAVFSDLQMKKLKASN